MTAADLVRAGLLLPDEADAVDRASAEAPAMSEAQVDAVARLLGPYLPARHVRAAA